MRPLVAVAVPLKVPGASREVEALVDGLTVSALRLLTRSGADLRVIDVSSPERPSLADGTAVDGIVLLGGGDIDPTVYGFSGDVDGLYGVDRAADDYSLALVRRARAEAVPILGICRGSQVINVAHGGTLIPDIEEPSVHRGVAPAELFVDEDIALEPSSWIGRLYEREAITVRNGHHQAVDRVAPGLRAVAHAADGIVEAVEAESGWCVGVQWHPEERGGSAADATRLFAAFVDVCRAVG